MKTILGLDLGVASIGWAIVKEDNDKQFLAASGVRVIPIDSTTASDYSKGASTSKSGDRRQKRGARRNIHRYKLRKHKLIDFLKENNLWPLVIENNHTLPFIVKDKDGNENNLTPLPADLFQYSSLQLYGLHHKALSEQISLFELARIWFHLNQKRGYIDSRKGISEDEKDTQYVEAIKKRSEDLNQSHQTVGSYFYHRLIENPIYRIKSGDDKENIFLSTDYQEEFEKIWEKQKEFYPDFLTEANHDEVYKRIIYHKRKLKSQKILISNCRFEKTHKCMPISSPVAEEIRLWQDINKLKITSKYHEVFLPASDQKTELFEYLLNNEKITEKGILGKFQFPTTKGEYKLNIDKFLKGYVFRAKLFKLLEAHSIDKSIFTGFDGTSNSFTDHPFYKLWHLLYATEETDNLRELLKSKYNFNDELTTQVVKLSIKNDFASLSSRAARKLFQYLREGKMYHEACESAGYNHSDSITKEENEARKILPIEELTQIKPNELKNPTVEKILNQLINLLKGLKQDGHEFDEIRIELARELKKNAKERQRAFDSSNANKSENEKAFNAIKEHIARPSKKDIEKYKLWKEFDGCSPYEPNIRIELQDLFDRLKYDVDHIIPKSRLFDDSFANKAIARVYVNQQEKKQQTALDYMASKGEEKLHQYIECIKHNKNLSFTKRKYFQTKGTEIPEDFINRQLNETRYITSETLKILKSVCREVHSTSGSVTDYLRHHWGYDNVLMNLNFDRVSQEEIEIKEINGHKRKVIKNWSKRNDHRHHAVDAIVIACTKQNYIQQLNSLNADYDKPDNANIKSVSIKTRIPFEYDTVKQNIENILISFKAGKRVATRKTVRKDRWGKEPGNLGQTMLVPRGALHEESVYGNNRKYERIELKVLGNIDECVVPWQKEAIHHHLSKYNIDLKTALKDLKKRPVIYEDNKVLEKVTIYKKEHVKRYNLEYSATNKFDKKAAQYIVNKNVRDIILKRLQECGDDPAKAFKNLKEKPIYFNEEKGIIIKSVRCYIGGQGGYPALHETQEGKTFNNKQGLTISDKQPVDFVRSGNNHHIAIYENEDGKRVEECVTFMEAFERRLGGQDVIQLIHPKGYRFIMSLQQNEMFVFDMTKEDLSEAIDQNNFSIISKNLYRVQQLYKGQNIFRHHLETSVDNPNWKKQTAGTKLTAIKVKISNTNKISISHD